MTGLAETARGTTHTASIGRAAARLALAVAMVATLAGLVVVAPAVASPGATTRESLSTTGGQGNSFSDFPDISDDGSVVAFVSDATNLVSGDDNGQRDVFVRDRPAGTLVRASVTPAGTDSAGFADFPAISGNGRYVAFESNATDLVAGSTGSGRAAVFVRDLQTSITVQVSVASDGTASNGDARAADISADGRYVTFFSDAADLVLGDTNGQTDIFLHDRDVDGDGVFDEAGAVATSRVSVAGDGAQANDASSFAAISGDGTHVAFSSSATNLVMGDTNDKSDVFVRNTAGAGRTTRVSVDSAGAQSNGFLGSKFSISANGRQVAFDSQATNLVAGDTNEQSDVFVRDRDADGDGIFDESGAATTTRVSVTSDGAQAVGGGSFGPSISSDGARVAFASGASNLLSAGAVLGVFVHDRDADGDRVFDQAGPGATATTLESVASNGEPAANAPFGPASIAGNGRLVAFDSDASTLVPGDDNNTDDVFVHVLAAPIGRFTLSVSRAGDGVGSVTSVPAGIDCGTDCTGDYVDGTMVTLTAGAGARSTFTGFSGACTGATCTVTLDQARSVTATFGLIQRTLTVVKAGDGAGTVTSLPAGIDCGSDCTQDFGDGTEVTLTAVAASGSQFAGFGGSCAGSGLTCTVSTLDQARSVTATFERIRRTLTIAKAGDGAGTVTSSPAGIACGSDCTEAFVQGTAVTLSAAPSSGSRFAGFSGACTGASCAVSLDQARSVTATFEAVAAVTPPPPPPVMPGPAPPPPPPVLPGDDTAPVLSAVRLTRTRFAVSAASTSLSASAAAARKGTSLRYTLSEAASVKIVVAQRRSGRRKGSSCVAATRALRKARACTRVTRRGTLTRKSKQGANRVAFSGRIGSRRLAPGRYQLTLTATDASGNVSKPRTVTFTVVRR